MSNLRRFVQFSASGWPYSFTVLITQNPHRHAAQHRLTRRIHQLLQFHASYNRMPSATIADHYERGLYLFTLALKTKYREDLLSEEHLSMLRLIPLNLEAPSQASMSRDQAFLQWLTRVENFVKDNGFRPGCAQENDLYQWIVRARRRLDAGHLDEITERRLTTVLAAPDRRRYRAQTRHLQVEAV